MAPNWLMWQLADSAFPTGGFAHSSGLEAVWQHGMIRGGSSIAEFLRSGLVQCNQGVLKFVGMTWKDPAAFLSIDHDCDLFLNNHVANRASRGQGRALFSSITRIIPNESLAEVSKYVRDGRTAVHLAPVFGAVCASLGVDEPQALELFLFVFARGCISSAVRLGIIGPLEAQHIQYHLAMAEYLSPAGQLQEPIQISPVLDLLQATQDRLYSKLFQS